VQRCHGVRRAARPKAKPRHQPFTEIAARPGHLSRDRNGCTMGWLPAACYISRSSTPPDLKRMARLIHTATGSPFQLAGMKTMLSATFVATSLKAGNSLASHTLHTPTVPSFSTNSHRITVASVPVRRIASGYSRARSSLISAVFFRTGYASRAM